MELLERDDVLNELRQSLQQANDGLGSLLLVGGEAGIGKTSLLRRFSDEASSSARVLQGQCDPLSTPRALGPVFDLEVPALTGLLDKNTPRDRFFRGMLTLLSDAHRPTLLAIEDGHWADEATLDLLRYLGRRIERTRALIVVTYRDDEVGPRHGLRRVLGDLATVSAVRRLTLRPLTFESVEAMAAGSVTDPGDLYARSKGNPFFVTEILAAGGEIPATVQDAVLARAGNLPTSAWQALEAAAVIGLPFEARLLTSMVPISPEDLDACLESGMLRIEGATVAFRHELAREAILHATPPTRQKVLHAAILRVLEALPAERRDPARLAHHADEAGDAEAVLRHAPEAARRAQRLRAHREAADQYERTLRYASDLPREERAELLEARSYACYLTAKIDQAIAASTEALAIWIAIGNPRKEGENRCHLAELYWAQARIADAEHEAEAAVALMEQHSPGAELAMALGTQARLSGISLETDDAIVLGEKAIALAEQFGATETLIDALMTVGEARLARGALEVGQEQLETSMRLSNDAGLEALTSRAYNCFGHGFAEHNQFETATHYFELGIRFCVERDLDLPLQHMKALLARCHLRLGNWDDAVRLATSVLSAREVAPASRCEALHVAGLVMARRGEPGAWSFLDEAKDLATASGCIVYVGPIQAARAEAAFLSAQREAASLEARDAFDLAMERGDRWYIGELGYWRWKCGDLTSTPQRAAEPYASQIAGELASAVAAWDALGCPYEAARARAEGNEEAALRLALGTFESLGAHPAASIVRRDLRELGVRGIPRGPRRSTRANAAGLTSREVEVVTLLAQGLGNQEIASHLFLSARTVENHVAAILAKLGAATRGEAVDVAHRLACIPPNLSSAALQLG